MCSIALLLADMKGDNKQYHVMSELWIQCHALTFFTKGERCSSAWCQFAALGTVSRFALMSLVRQPSFWMSHM